MKKVMQVHYRKIDELLPYANNARQHSPKQLRKLATNIAEFGFLGYVLIDQNNIILAGHARTAAAKMAGLEEVPTVLIDHLTEAQKRAFILADNRLAQEATWDYDKLKQEFEFLELNEAEYNLTGFDTAEIDFIFDDGVAKADPADILEVPLPGYRPVTLPDDVWKMGEHLLFCGDSTAENTYRVVMSDGTAAMIFTDPPYNVPINGHVKKSGGAVEREFVMASGEMSEETFMQFLVDFSVLAACTCGMVRFSSYAWTGDISMNY